MQYKSHITSLQGKVRLSLAFCCQCVAQVCPDPISLLAGDGGAIFDGTVQTPLVRADSGNELRSVTQRDTEFEVFLLEH